MTGSEREQRFLVSACSIFVSALLLGACASHPRPAPASLCEVRGDFERYQGRLVVLHASVRSDAHHQSSLTDQLCPWYGAQLSYSDDGVRNGSAQRLHEAIFAKPPGTLKKSIDVTVTGRLTREAADAGGLFVFVADSITDVKVTEKSKEE